MSGLCHGGHPRAGMGIWHRRDTGNALGWCIASSRPRFPCVSPASGTFGLSHPGVFNFRPHFWAFSAPKPLVPQIFGLPRAGTGRSEAQLCVTGCTQLSPSPQEDFGDRMSPDTPRCNVGAVLWPPCPNATQGGGQSHPCGCSLGMRRAEPQQPTALAEANQRLPNFQLSF